jgi:glycosyltransferase involved in cell wall biosynthesis
VPPNDESALLQAILQVLKDDDLRQHLREAGPRRAANFSWKHTAEKTLEIYQQVLSA